MIAGLKPYPDLIHLGLPLVGVVPAEWKTRKLRQLLDRVAFRNRPDLPLLSVVREKGVILRDRSSSDENHNFVPDDLTNYKVVRCGQFVVNKMKAWAGSFGVSRYDGIVSPAYYVFNLRDVTSEFFDVAIRSKAYVPAFARASDGVRVGQWDLSDARMREIQFLVPPPADQAAIVRFIQHTDRQIRRSIRARQKLALLLEEEKQAIIHRAVTRGLDPNVRLKSSGVEGLHDIPHHWDARSFARCAIEKADYRGATPTKTDSGVFLVTARNVRKGWIDYETSKEFVAETDYAEIMRRGLPKLGDLLFTMEAPLGNAALVDREDVALAQRVIRFRLNPLLLAPSFALASILSPYFQNQLQRRATGSTAQGLKASKLPQLQILLPPLAEQRAILEQIDLECRPIDDAVRRSGTEIALLSAYRTRLIADLVTGRLDVRDAASRLLEEPSSETPEDEASIDGEGSEESENAIEESVE